LKQQITTRHIVNSSFGQGHYFEFVLQNPFNSDQIFQVQWDSTDLRIVTDDKECRFHRQNHSIMYGVEKNMVQMKPDGSAQVFLAANESLPIPFIYQNMTDETTADIQNPNNHLLLNGDPAATSRVIHVSFIGKRSVPIAILDIIVNSRNFYIDRCIRLFKCENELLNKVLRSPMSNGMPSVTRDGLPLVEHPHEKYLKCNNGDVVCSQPDTVFQLIQRSDGHIKQVKFKYRVGNAPDVKSLYFIFYNDQYCTSVHEIWRVFVHSVFRYIE
jgi:hypothetical protein